VVVYEMVTGKVPFSGTTPLSIMRGHADKPPPSPSEINPDISPAVEAVLLKALAKKREERYQSAGEMAVALQQAVSGAVAELVPAPPPAEPARPVLPWKWVVGIGAVIVVAVGLIIALVSGGGPTVMPTSTPEAAALAPTATPTTVPIKTPTSVPPTSTPLPPMPTDTLEPAPTDTPVLPTDTPVPPTNTPSPSAPSSDMVHVPAGEFIMGSSDAEVDSALALCNEVRSDCLRIWLEDERPQHAVYLDAFYIDRTEVTNAQYRKGAEAGVCNVPSNTAYYDKADYAQHPVVSVSWNDADAYCRWAGKRLPTEAEWEKAARGTDGLIYPWGNTFDGTKLNFADKNTSFDWSDSNWDDGYADTAPVGSYPDGASPYGALDMAGNVAEWVADRHDSSYYAASPESNPKGPASGSARVIRGGSWHINGALVRAAVRSWHRPDLSLSHVGFRCAR
jgi:formylglycine-generating enzyme required for sulfatase activity